MNKMIDSIYKIYLKKMLIFWETTKNKWMIINQLFRPKNNIKYKKVFLTINTKNCN